MQHVHDLIGIGFGPNNIALAVHISERSMQLDCLFLEARPGPDWHPYMLLDTVDVQHVVVRDFISPVEPRSYFSFINYLKLHDRLLEHFNAPTPFPLRKELAAYVRWAAQHFSDQVRYDTRVTSIGVDQVDGHPVFAIETDDGSTHFGHQVVLGSGRTPQIPPVFRDHLGPQVFHLTSYRQNIDALCANRDRLQVAVIGSSQSGAEIMLDLHRRPQVAGAHAVMRSYGFRLKDLSPFTERVFFPGFVSWFNELDEASRSHINARLSDAIYNRVDTDALHSLYNAWYEERLDGVERIQLHPFSEVAAIAPEGDRLGLTLREHYSQRRSHLAVDAVVLATGFLRLGPEADAQKVPPLLEPISDRLEREESGCVHIRNDYSVRTDTDLGYPLALYLNGYAETSHSIGDAGSFPLMAYRADRIAWSLRQDRMHSLRAG